MPISKKTSKEPRQTAHSSDRGSRSKKGFDAIMTETTRHMPRHQRLFSRFIHAKAIFSVSSILANTIARPNALLIGALVSFAATLGAYLLAKNLGYSLSGFEAIGAFTVGWLIGLLLDLILFIIKKK